MMASLELWQYIKKQISIHGKVVLGKVVDSKGSSPGRIGFTMAVSPEGKIYGTIGGGVMEFNMMNQALSLMKEDNPKPMLIVQNHKKNVLNSSGLTCSGSQTISLTVLDKSSAKFIKAVLDYYKYQENKLLVLSSDGSYLEDVSDMKDGQWNDFAKEGKRWKYREIFGQPNTAYIFGGGHVGLAISKIMNAIGFYVVVIDPRKDAPTVLNNVYADELIIVDYAESSEYIREGNNSYAIVATSDRTNDYLAVKGLLRKNLKYLGMMGSSAKISSVFKSLKEDGFTPAEIAKIKTPIGIEINSETTEEIGVSIAAEIISVKNKKQ